MQMEFTLSLLTMSKHRCWQFSNYKQLYLPLCLSLDRAPQPSEEGSVHPSGKFIQKQAG